MVVVSVSLKELSNEEASSKGPRKLIVVVVGIVVVGTIAIVVVLTMVVSSKEA